MQMIPWGQPVTVLKDRTGMIVSCWKMSIRERFRAFLHGKVYVESTTQHVRPSVNEP